MSVTLSHTLAKTTQKNKFKSEHNGNGNVYDMYVLSFVFLSVHPCANVCKRIVIQIYLKQFGSPLEVIKACYTTPSVEHPCILLDDCSTA